MRSTIIQATAGRGALCAVLIAGAASCDRLTCTPKGGPMSGPADAGAGDAGSVGPGSPGDPPSQNTIAGGFRFVATKNEGQVDCPLSSASSKEGWKVRPLVSVSAPLPAALSRVCIYTRDNAATDKALAALEAEITPSPGGLAALAEEYQSVYPMGLGEDLAASFRTSLHAQAGGLAALPLPPPSATRVVMIDTDPDRFSGVPEACPSSHGCTLAHIAKDLLCPQRGQGPCAGEVGWAEGLAHAVPGSSSRFGYPSDVAAAMLRAYDAWRTQLISSSPSAAPPHLILNLSLGWETNNECNDKGGSRTTMDAVGYLACNGVLVVASAGNAHRADASPSNMACPARHEGAGVSEDDCSGSIDAALLAAYRAKLNAPQWAAIPPTSSERASMIYSVGGLDYADRPIVPERSSSRPVLAAPAVGGVSWAAPLSGAAPAAPPTFLSGTSVSAAIVSGVAATVWAYRPDLRADQVMKIVAENADEVKPTLSPTSVGAPLSAGGHRVFSLTTVRRVSLCKALSAAVSNPPAAGFPCPSLMTAAANPWPAGGGPAPTTSTPSVASPAASSACTADPANAETHVFPHPNNPRCPQCYVQPSWNNTSQPAFLGVLTDGAPVQRLSLFLREIAPSGIVTETIFNLDPADLTVSRGVVQLTLGRALSAGATAWLSWEENQVTVGQTIYVAR